MPALCAANWPLILEYLKVVFSWPVVAGSLLLLALLLFKAEIRRLIDRTKGFEAFGGKLDAGLVQQQASSEGTIPPPPTTVAASGQLPSSKFGTASATQGPPPKSPIDEVSSDPERAKAEILKWWSIAKYESVYNVVFGTQLRLLAALSQKPATGELVANLMPFYLEHQTLAGAAAVPLGNFLTFLITNELIRLEGVGDEQRAHLTLFGRDFLVHVVRTYGNAATARSY